MPFTCQVYSTTFGDDRATNSTVELLGNNYRSTKIRATQLAHQFDCKFNTAKWKSWKRPTWSAQGAGHPPERQLTIKLHQESKHLQKAQILRIPVQFLLSGIIQEITKLSEWARTEMNAREQQIADSAQRWRAQGCCDGANTEMLRMDALYLKFRATGHCG